MEQDDYEFRNPLFHLTYYTSFYVKQDKNRDKTRACFVFNDKFFRYSDNQKILE